MNDGLSTFKFAIYLLIGLTVFTVAVAVLSKFRYKDYQEKEFEAPAPTPAPTSAESGKSDSSLPRPSDNVAAKKSKSFKIPEFSYLLPENPILEEVEGKPVRYVEDNRPVLVARVDPNDPQVKTLKSQIKELVGRIFHYQTSPKTAAKWLRQSANVYLSALNHAEGLMKRDQGRVKVRYQAGMDMRLIVGKSVYLANLKILIDMTSDGVPGMPPCAAQMPNISDLTSLPPLPTFDPLMREGQNALESEYDIGRMMADPFEVIENIRDHIEKTTTCVMQVNPQVYLPTRIVEVTDAVNNPAPTPDQNPPSGVQGPLPELSMPDGPKPMLTPTFVQTPLPIPTPIPTSTPTPAEKKLSLPPGALAAPSGKIPTATPSPTPQN